MMNFAKVKHLLPAMTLTHFNFFFAVWIAIGLNLEFFQQLKKLTPYTGLQSIGFIAASVCIVIAFYNLIFQILHWNRGSKLLAALWIVLGGLSGYFVNNLGIAITSDQIQNMVQTDVRESLDLMNWHFFTWIILFIILPLLLLSLVKIRKELLGTVLLKKLFSAIGSLLVIGVLLFAYYVDFAAIFREHRDLKGMLSPQNVISSSISYYKHQAPSEDLPLVTYGRDAHRIENIDNLAKPKLMVLVVGETARAESFSLNGYNKPTNPELSKLPLINFTQVSSCGTATAVSVPCMFSGMPRKDYDAKLAHHRENLLDIAQHTGYRVTWIDNNSGCKDVCNRVNNFSIPEPIRKKWCASDGECQDGILIDSLNAYIASLPKDDTESHLVVLHQMGSHGPAYYKRSRNPYQPFQPTCDSSAIQGCSRDELINSYDNSIVYTDHILSSIIHRLDENKNYQTGFWYLSDHGESTGEHGLYLHGAPYAIAPSQQTHVPMMMWFSKTWQNQQPQIVSCLNARKNSAVSQDNLFPTLLHLLEIKTHTQNAQLDLLDQCHAKQASA